MKYLHSMVRVSNIEESLDFYCNKLGLVEVKRIEVESDRFTYMVLSAPDDLIQVKENNRPMLELIYNWDHEQYSDSRNFGHLAFSVINIYEICQKLQDSGVTILRPPRDGYMAFIKSPDLISIELLQEGDRLSPEEPWLSMESQGGW